ncbi:unnamed protein product [Calypogeia fissa]
MQATSIGAFAPLALLCAAFGSWSLISLLFLVAFFIVQYNVRSPAPPARPRPALWMSVVLLATAIIVTEGFVELVWAMLGTNSISSDSPLLVLLGLARLNPWEGSARAFLSLVPQFAVALIAACALYQEQQQHSAGQVDWDREGPNWWATLRSLLLPTAQILVGVARPSWIALPYFVCSCVGLLHWSVTSSIAGLSWIWKPLLWCTGAHIVLLYVYQLPIAYPESISDVADYIGLYRASYNELGWPEAVQAGALIAFYVLMCFAINDLQAEHASQRSATEGSVVDGSLPRYRSGMISPPSRHTSDDSITQTLLPSQDEASTRETIPLSRRWDADQRRAIVFQHATINFITYGFPICLIALVGWSFLYASFCAFGLLLYVGYIFYAFPSIHILRRLNPILLGFILSWSLSTYVFNAAFTVISEQSQMGMEIWHSIGLWHYVTPGLFIFAQYALGVLIATDIFVSNAVMKNMSEVESPPNDDQGLTSGDQEDWKVLILAVVAWCLRRSAYVLSLALIFVVGMKDGLLNAVYMGFFLVYLVSAAVAKRTRQHLILFCEIHFAALYLLQLDWIAGILKDHEAQLKTVLRQLGLWEKGSFQDFVSIALLLCFLAVQSHGVKVLSSLSATIHHSPQPPLGWGILRVGSGRSVLLSVYASQNFGYLQQESNDDVNWVTKNLAAIAEIIRSTYRSFGTYIAYGTVLIVIYFVEPNYISLGYLCLLLVWVIGRQILGHTEAPLWYPMMVFAGVVFVFRYALTAIPALQDFTSDWFSLHKDFGFNKDASLLGHLWDSLAILCAMQLYRFERSQVAVLVEGGDQINDSMSSGRGVLGFLRRFIILHCGKVLTLAVFFSCITPVSATGFLYLVMLIVTCNMSKSSRLPAQLFAVYTGLLAVTEYLFQMWGDEAEMFPGQAHGEFALWIGFHVYGEGFKGTEFGLRTKVLVLVACILQYTSFRWLDQLPSSLRAHGQFEEPCPLFLPYRYRNNISHHPSVGSESGSEKTRDRVVQVGLKIGASDVQNGGQTGILHRESSKVSEDTAKGKTPRKLTYVLPDAPSSSPKTPIRDGPGSSSSRDTEEFPSKSKLGSPWGSAKESRRWTKRAVLLVKQERYEAQCRTLSIYVKHKVENFFQLYGLEVCMLSLLMASFALLNVISLLYVFVLGICILLKRPALRIIWPFLVISFALVLVVEYAVLGKKPPSWIVPPSLHESDIRCTNCLYSPNGQSAYCWKCWLGLAVDDRQMLAAHFMVFFFASLQLRANMLAGNALSRSIHTFIPPSDRLAWKEMSFETSGEWTWLDHGRFLFYRHLLHVVLLLVFVTGTLQYDVLHLGYLTFSLVLFRMRSTLMIKRNSIFRFLRLYNFILIAASLIYQAPYFGSLSTEKCAIMADVYNIVGLYKMRFGFRITARSALVDITIFCVAGLQAYVFRSREFDQVLRYLESQQVEARAHAQEDKATWKKEHLQRIRAIEEQKLQRRLQVEKMKTDMVHLQLRLDVLNSTGKFNEVISPMIELDDRGGHHPSFTPFSLPDSTGAPSTKERHPPHGIQKSTSDSGLQAVRDDAIVVSPLELSDETQGLHHTIRRRIVPQIPDASQSQYNSTRADALPGQPQVLRQTFSSSDIQFAADTENSFLSTLDANDRRNDDPLQKQRVMTGVQLLEDGVAQVHNLGNKALANLVGLFNLEQSDRDDTESSSTDDEARPESKGNPLPGSIPATSSQDHQQAGPAEAEKLRITDTWRRLSILFRYFFSQIASNTDVVCYFFFVLAYIWNFSVLTLMYPAVLFLYALLANPGPSQQFWFFMLVYTELNILVQYMYQIHAQNCDGQDVSEWLQKIGIPASTMSHSFVICVLPLFLVYLSTLVQSSIKARDGEWMFVDEGRSFLSARRVLDPEGQTHYATLKERLWKIVKTTRDAAYTVCRGLSLYWRALGSGSEAPPHFVQVSLHVGKWPEDGIQPERIESQFNRLLAAVHHEPFQQVGDTVEKELSSRIRVESIENSPEKPSMALAVLEVIYAAPPQECAGGRDHHTLTPAADVAAELQKAKDEGHPEETGFPYPIMSIIPGGKREVDLYALIFGTDLIAFLYVALFYQSVIKHSSQLLDVYQVGDQFPKEFVFVLMTLFFLIMVDRVLYLCSFATGKVLYYFFGLALYTGYVAQSVWGILETAGTDLERNFWQMLPLRGFYMIKALSLALQAVQLKYGLPHKSNLYGQFLTRKISGTSWIGFRLYRSIPFLYELRCLLDWSCATTALTMYDWLKLEDIYASLFLVQCDIKIVREKHRLGQKQPVFKKFYSGILLFFTLIGVIWAPMLIYSSGNPTNIVNKINDVRTRVELKTVGGTFNLYETGLCRVPFLGDLWEEGRSTESLDMGILFSSDPIDVQVICCEEDAESQWMVPPPTVRTLYEYIDDDFTFQIEWEFHRTRPKGSQIAYYIPEKPPEMNVTEVAQQFRQVLNGTLSSVTVPSMYPRYLSVPGSGDVRPLDNTDSVSCNLTLNRDGSTMWWSFQRSDADTNDTCGTANGPMAVTVSEEVANGIIGETLSKFSIWSLYLTFVLAVGRFIRLQCSDIRMRIPFENFPSCDRLLAICEDIYAARAERELELEEGLFWTLIKIYRSPHILMEYTKKE